MDFGIGLLGYHECWKDAAFAEQRGFATANILDSQLLGAEMFAHLALIAQATSTIRVGTLLAIPSNRHVAVTAQGIASVNRIAPGRTFLGLGSGYTARNTMGLPAVPAGVMRDYALDCRRLLDGEEILYRENDRERWIRFGQREGLHINLEDHVPVWVGGDGPKALRAVGESADGWVTTMQNGFMMAPHVIGVFKDSLAQVKAVAEGAGRTWDDDRSIVLSTGLCILVEGESPTSPRVLERVGPMAMLAFHSATDRPALLEHLPPFMQERYPIYKERVLDRLPGPPEKRYQHYHRGHLAFLLPGEEEVLTDEIIRATTLTGTIDEVTAQIREFEAAGLKNITVWTPPHKTREYIDEVADDVMPALEAAPV
jgi:alkanesulfonate monooxygenase SsuD/methylene tetrahydromethanopterin reductase-like flavin-dependent oxidoreductase (luciferase family)